MSKKHTYARKCTTFIRKFTKKFPLIFESTRRDRNAIIPKFSSTVNNKNKVISSGEKLYRICQRHKKPMNP